MPRPEYLRAALRQAHFRRLFAVRLAGQFGDGVFQAALAATVLFNPERQARPADIAAGFAVVLLPYSCVGPFAGVLLDRWWRQRVLVVASVFRAVAVVGVAAEIARGWSGETFYVSALVVISVNRFFLSALSAALPHTVPPGSLVTANALSTTSGSVATTVGAAAAIGLRAVAGSTDSGYALIALVAAAPYLAAALTARPFPRALLGPDDTERARRERALDVLAELAAGARHVAERRSALAALIMITAHRFCYGVSTVIMLLLYRNYFADEGALRAGLSGLGQFVVAVAVGAGLAAVVTPAATRRLGRAAPRAEAGDGPRAGPRPGAGDGPRPGAGDRPRTGADLGFARWPTLLLAAAAALTVGLGLPFQLPLVLVAGFGLGFTAQGVKISVDTLLQRVVADDFRGRVFSFYDTLFNIAFVAAAVLAALALPDTGHSPAAIIALGAGYALIALGYLRTATRAGRHDDL